MTKDKAGNEVKVPPITTQQILARTRERKAKSTLLMSIPDEHLARFHGIKDAKTLWAAIKTIFGAWSNISLIMRNKPDIDNLDIDDLYNNLKVYEADIKGYSGSSSNSQNVAFVFTESTSSTNEPNAAYSVSTATGHSSQAQGSSSYADELMFSFFVNQSSSPQLNNEDLEQIDQHDLEELVLTKPRLGVLTIMEDGTLPGIAEQPGTQGTGVEMLGMQEEEATDFALMAFTSNHSSSSSLNSEFNEKEVLDVKEEEVTKTVFDNLSSDKENSLANDRFKKGKEYHAVPPPLTGNYMLPKSDISFARLDDSIYKFKISETVTSLTKDKKMLLKLVLLLPTYILVKIDFVKAGESDKPIKYVKHVKPVKPVKTAEQIKKSKNFSSSPTVDRKDWNGKITQKLGLGFGFTKKACFVCGSMSHLIKYCTFHEDRMAKKYVFPNNVGKGTVFTRSGRIPVSAAKPKATASTSAAKPVNTVRPKQIVNFLKSRSTFHKLHSPIRRSFYNATAHSRRNSTKELILLGQKQLVLLREMGLLLLRPQQGHPQKALKNKGIVDSGCSRHMTGNKAYLADYQEINDGGFVAFGLRRGIQTDENAGPQDTNGMQVLKIMLMQENDKAADDKPKDDTGSKTVEEPVNKEDQAYRDELDRLISQEKEASDAADALRKKFEQGCMNQIGATKAGSTNSFNTVSNPVNVTSTSGTLSASRPSSPHPDAFIPANTLLHVNPNDSQIPDLEDTAELRSTGLQVKQSEKGIFISQDKYVAEILKNFDFSSVKTASTPIKTQNPLVKYEEAADVTPKLSHLHAVKRIFRRLISWQCKKQTIVATSTTEAEYVAAAN
nr:ribonuclease H-like domain-containing protein [Tanacetum cinerariifolium]